jgi:hypothetical protein
MASVPELGDAMPSSRYYVERYGKSRNWALYEGEGNKLVTVAVYKKGAGNMQRELEARDATIAALAARIEQLTRTLHASPEPATGRFQDPLSGSFGEIFGGKTA